MLTVDFNKLDLVPGTMVLDAGCGSGRHVCEAFRRPGVGVVGIDLRWEDLCQTRGYLSMMGGGSAGPWLVVKGDVTRLPFADGTFDVVVCSEVLEHIPDGKAAIREGKKVREARLRLEAMCETNDGFRLAELDLKLRGAGDVNGTLQSGMAFDLKIANPTLDSQILTVTREAAAEVLTADPTLAQNGHEGLRELRKRYSGREEIDFSQIS